MGRTSDARQRLMDAAYDLIWEYSYGAITIEAICERAAVKKGSFYYFFESKSELAITAIDAWWKQRGEVLAETFDFSIPPLERVRGYLDYIAARQLEHYATTGQILGCPIYGLGAEVCTQDVQIRDQIKAILKGLGDYFESAIREAQELGHLEGGQPAKKARTLLYYYAGMLTQARIENDPGAVRCLSADGLELIGARQVPALPVFIPKRGLTLAKPDEQLVPLP
jgi:TetR/AcrR family transcriptional repressor of nem operon